MSTSALRYKDNVTVAGQSGSVLSLFLMQQRSTAVLPALLV